MQMLEAWVLFHLEIPESELLVGLNFAFLLNLLHKLLIK